VKAKVKVRFNQQTHKPFELTVASADIHSRRKWTRERESSPNTDVGVNCGTNGELPQAVVQLPSRRMLLKMLD